MLARGFDSILSVEGKPFSQLASTIWQVRGRALLSVPVRRQVDGYPADKARDSTGHKNDNVNPKPRGNRFDFGESN
jgi:hypothetical protein